MGKIYKYVDMNIFGILYKMYIAKISLACIMEAEPKIFLNLLQFITIILQYYSYNVIVYYVTSLYLSLHLNFLYLHLNVLALRFGIFYSNLSRMD